MSTEGTTEGARLLQADAGVGWRRWGPYLSERQWGTVREDYSEGGDAWSYFPHDQARARAYRWGEDGIAGVSDDKQRLCLSVALWNGRDPILKERLFGLTNAEGNHGEDVKECYFYLDSTPTHSYMKYLYKYPQREFPYADLAATNRARGRHEFEYELLDTGAFEEDRYFDVVIEYAKGTPEDLLARITVHNRAPEPATVHVLPTLWFRNTWSWGDQVRRPRLSAADAPDGVTVVTAEHEELGRRWLCCQGDVPVLFTENDTNTERLFGAPNSSPYVKDGIDRFVVHGETGAVNPDRVGTKASAHYVLTVPASGSATVRLRLVDVDPTAPPRGQTGAPLDARFDQLLGLRRSEADEFYASIAPADASDDERRVVRQALAGMLWSKQYYYLDVERWLTEHHVDPLDAPRWLRNHDWFHMVNDDILSMPDKWEYPWFAAWDLAFHAVALAMVDIGFAKQQLDILLRRSHLHPNGQIPAYEWNFSDVNPPVHAWATYLVYLVDKARRGTGDVVWLESAFQKLSKYFTWWLNRKDADGRNIFQGGFLGLDNIGVFDRSAPLPTGGHIDQADGTAWMALFAQNMLQISLELAEHDPVYAEHAETYFEHFAWISSAMNHMGTERASMWDEEDGFFYDVLRTPDGDAVPLKVRSMVGLLPLAAATVLPAELDAKHPEVLATARDFLADHPSVLATVSGDRFVGPGGQRLFALFGEDRLRRILARMLDEEEFLSPFGVRSVSKHHAAHPYTFDVHGERYQVSYLPAESDTGMFGGNSNWRGPIWFPVNVLLIRALVNLYGFYGDDFRVECPTGSGQQMTLYEVAQEIARRLTGIFLPDRQGRRPVHGGQQRFATDPHWRDLVLFYEYFHGDNGAGIGASHQTGWTGLVAVLAYMFKGVTAEEVRTGGLEQAVRQRRTRLGAKRPERAVTS